MHVDMPFNAEVDHLRRVGCFHFPESSNRNQSPCWMVNRNTKRAHLRNLEIGTSFSEVDSTLHRFSLQNTLPWWILAIDRRPPCNRQHQVEGVVTEGLPSAMFRVEIGDTGRSVLCTISGKIRKNFVRILVGDPVKVELSPYDLTRGRITFRYKWVI